MSRAHHGFIHAPNPKILAIDTAGSTCAAAVSAGEELLAARSVAMMHGHAKALLPMVNDVIGMAGLGPDALDCIVVTVGPGSFTGIRVGIAAARGIAFASGVPLIGVSSFEAVAETVPIAVLARRTLVVALESRRADLYIQLFNSERRALLAPAAIPPDALAAIIEGRLDRNIAIAGDAAPRAVAGLTTCCQVLIVESAGFPIIGAINVGWRRWRDGEYGDEVQPFYLRPPDVSLASAPPP